MTIYVHSIIPHYTLKTAIMKRPLKYHHMKKTAFLLIFLSAIYTVSFSQVALEDLLVSYTSLPEHPDQQNLSVMFKVNDVKELAEITVDLYGTNGQKVTHNYNAVNVKDKYYIRIDADNMFPVFNNNVFFLIADITKEIGYLKKAEVTAKDKSGIQSNTLTNSF